MLERIQKKVNFFKQAPRKARSAIGAVLKYYNNIQRFNKILISVASQLYANAMLVSKYRSQSYFTYGALMR